MRDKTFLCVLAGAVAVGSLVDARAKSADLGHKDQHPVVAVPIAVASTSAAVVTEFVAFDTITGEERIAPFGFVRFPALSES